MYNITNQPMWHKYAYNKKPDINILKQILENNNYQIDDTVPRTKAIHLKYQAITATPNLIEKTMSSEQLFNAKNPLWAQDYTIQELYYWFKYRKPFDGYEQVNTIIQSSEKLDKAIKKYNDIERS